MPIRMRAERRWYVEPLNPSTNEAIASLVRGEDAAEIRDAEGKTHKVWECPRSVVNSLLTMKMDPANGINFILFTRLLDRPLSPCVPAPKPRCRR